MTELNAQGLKRIHVNQHKLRSRVKDPTCQDHCYTVKFKGKTYTAKQVFIQGDSQLVERIDNPLSCGARLWIETHGPIKLEQ